MKNRPYLERKALAGKRCPDCDALIAPWGSQHCRSCAPRYKGPRRAKPQYGDEELLDMLRKWAAKHDGRLPVRLECQASPDLVNQATFARRFGSYEMAARLAGLSGGESGVNRRRPSSSGGARGLRKRARQMVTAGAKAKPGALSYPGYKP